ncbi:RSP_2648 family PIN domain-containing protein [Paracoccus shanxieyensis]|uniref:PIN domain-containing protein n=1 Tax=Paracoccus shanxieyensis TaxID=2675752 RepID=A0A6L6J1L1_9RHOB|nr:PIN domain-containing protein [Paracoccus shanxieyensis]MTH64664.1 PIN domain-containing protein [Paracoccus shanxieyensis]MTH87808.1 PIN domain-containing protein [Paracoccus shanxieyensis]
MTVVLDACVLYPTVLREILTDCAEAGLFQPVWSQRILDEWRHAADRQGLSAGVEIALLTARFPQALAQGAGGAEGLDLPDPADRHVVETALASGAKAIVTANLRDFPARALAAVGLAAVHPDEFLRDLYLKTPDPVLNAVAATQTRARDAGGAIPRKELMRRARLPRLAKAIERFDNAGVAPGRGSGEGRP